MMADPTPSTSQAPRARPISPDVLEPPSPEDLQEMQQDEPILDQQNEGIRTGSQDGARPLNPDAESTLPASSVQSAASVGYEGEDSRSTTTIAPWAFRGDLHNDNANSARPSSSQVNYDSATDAMTDESNSLSSMPEVHAAHTRRSEDHSDEPPAKIRRLSAKSNDEVDGETCPICLDTWGNTGEHRLVALKCGHLFGAECVERWLKAQPAKDRACPTCKSKATTRDIRPIYARRLVAADNSQLTALQKQIDVLQVEKSRVELELQKSRIAHRACAMQLEVLRSTLMKAHAPKEAARRSWRFALEKNLEVSKDGGCRVMTYNCRTYEFYVSQKSTNCLFPGYGFRKVSCLDQRPGQFVHLHPKPIRDLSYSQPRDLLLSAALDGVARVLERGQPSAGASVHAGAPLWSCAWDYLRTNEFYAGAVGGVVQHYDVRNPSRALRRLSAPGDVSPVVALSSTEFGLLACQLNSCWLWAGGEPRALPLEGPFASLAYDAQARRALVSCRPGGSQRARLALCRLRSAPGGEAVAEAEQTFLGGARASLMSRAAWVHAPGAAWAAAHSESDAALQLHGLDSARSLTLPASEPALDLCSVQVNGDSILAALSDARLRLYKAVPAS